MPVLIVGNIVFFKDSGWFIARHHEMDLQAQGKTQIEALDRLLFLMKATEAIKKEKAEAKHTSSIED